MLQLSGIQSTSDDRTPPPQVYLQWMIPHFTEGTQSLLGQNNNICLLQVRDRKSCLRL